MVLKELVFNTFYIGRVHGGLEITDFYVSTLGGCSGLKRTDF